MRRQWGRFAAYVLVCGTLLAGDYALNQRTQSELDQARHSANTVLRDNTLQGCIRGNDLRMRIAHNNAVLRRFLEAAAKARTAEGNYAVAREYRVLAVSLQQQRLVDCENTIQAAN